MKKFKTVIALALVAALLTPTAAHAEVSSQRLGAVSTLVGLGMMVAAYNYGTCPEGYSKHTFEGLETQCVYISSRPPYDSDVRSGGAEFKRPSLMWGGAAIAGAGILLMLLPDPVAKAAPSVAFTPKGVEVSKTIKF